MTITRYVVQMSFLSIPAAIIFSCFYYYRKKNLVALGLHSSLLREFSLVIYVMLIAGIVALKLRPVYYCEKSSGVWGNIILLVDRPSAGMLVNLVPFGSIRDIHEWIKWGTANLHDIAINVCGNFAAFVPVGYFTSALFYGATLARTAIVSGGLAILCEIGQYFLMRYASIDNVLINLLGAVCGYWLYLLSDHIFPKIACKLLCKIVKKEKE